MGPSNTIMADMDQQVAPAMPRAQDNINKGRLEVLYATWLL